MADIFNKLQLEKNKERAKLKFDQYDFLHDKISLNLIERLNLDYIKSKKILLLGNYGGKFFSYCKKNEFINQIYFEKDILSNSKFDIIISNLEIHFIDDLPKYFFRIKSLLNTNGTFLANLFGGESLIELRNSMIKTAEFLNIPYSPRTIPFCDIKSIGSLLEKANFLMPVIESNKLTITYKFVKDLMYHLRYTGQTNILNARSTKYLGRRFFYELEKIYLKNFQIDGKIYATAEIITITSIC